MLRDGGVRSLAHLGGVLPPEHVPFNVNHDITSLFQFNPEMDINEELERLAERWAGDYAPALLEAWDKAEAAILAFPILSQLYAGFGFVWYRLWARPLVPNIEAIPQSERAYYQDFMCTTPHNSNNVDLSRDVLFQLTTPEKSRVDIERIDTNLWQPMDEALAALEAVRKDARTALGEGNIIEDQLVRLRGLRCWFRTQRNVAAWISGVHGWLEVGSEREKQKHRDLLREMMDSEIENSLELQRLLDTNIEFISTTDLEETQLIYGRNLKQLLEKRIALMRRHIDDEPYIDPNYIENKASQTLE